MGTPLTSKYIKPDGSLYRSGTAYEFLEALTAAKACAAAHREVKPLVLVYRCNQVPGVKFNDLEREKKIAQWNLVEEFFAEFKNLDGSYKMSCKSYTGPSDFKDLLADELRDFISKYLEVHPCDTAAKLAQPQTVAGENPWQESPFPGLRPFTAKEAPIYHSRASEIYGLIDKLRNPANRFIAVVGSSGSGKSSLVAAGVLPALAQAAVEGSSDWHCVRLTPGELSDNPFTALVSTVKPELEKHGCEPRRMANDLFETPPQDSGAFNKLVAMVLQDRPSWAEVLLFIDQFEELFTVVKKKYRRPSSP